MADTVTDQTPATPSSDELKKVISDVAAATALSDSSIPLERKLSTGQVYRGNTPEELISELVKAQENASADRKRLADEVEQLRQERLLLAQQQQTVTQEDAYSPETYYKLFAKDPKEAQDYLDRFDPKKQEFNQTLEHLRRQSEIDRFKSAVGFSPSPDEAMTFGQEFAKSGLMPNADNFELIFHRLVRQGKIREQAISGIQGQQAPPPRLGGGSGGDPNAGFDMAAFERLPADQQAQVIERLRAQGWR